MIGNEQTALMVGKITALLAILVFLFMPLAGCEEITVNGLDLITNRVGDFGEDEWNIQMTVLSWLVIISAIGAFLSRRASMVLGFGILGLVIMIIFLIKIKGTDKELSQLIEIKPGAFLTLVCFLGTIFSGWWQSVSKTQERSKNKIAQCAPIVGEENKVQSAETAGSQERVNEFVCVITSSVRRFFLAPYEAMPQKTNDRLAVFYGCSAIFVIMALNFLFKFGRLYYMAGPSGFWLGLQFPIWTYGIYWLIQSYRKKTYPFDPKSGL